MTPTSSKTSQPTIFAGTRSWSRNSTYTSEAGLTGDPGSAAPAFVITCALVRIVPVCETTKPEPWAPTPPKYAKTVTTPGERSAKTRAAEKPDDGAAANGGLTRAAGVAVVAAGSRTTTVSVVEPPSRPAARPSPSAAAAPSAAQITARRATRTLATVSGLRPHRFPVETVEPRREPRPAPAARHPS